MSSGGLMGKGSPPAQPRFTFFIRIAILALSVVILALAAYSIAGFGYYGSSGVGGLLIFTVIKTWLIYGFLLFAELKAPNLFLRILALIGYAISIIFWLSAWAWAASAAAVLLSFDDYYGRYYTNSFKPVGGALAACAGLGAIVWVLSIVNLVFFVKACLADKGMVQNQAELGQVHHGNKQAEANVYPTQAPGQYQAQPGYQQQQQQPYGHGQGPYQQPQ